MPRGPRVKRWCSLALLLGGVGCGGSPQAPLPASHSENATTSRDGERPPLSVVRRDGDPSTALGIAIAHDAGPAYNRRLAKALGARLSKLGLEPHTTLFTRGLVVSATLGGRASGALSELRSAILGAGEAVAGDASPVPELALLDPCDPLPAYVAEPPELGRDNVSLALVGSDEELRSLVAGLSDGDSWPEGDAPEAPLPEHDVDVLAASERNEVVVSLATPEAERLLGARQALVGDNLLSSVAAQFPPGFLLGEVKVAFGPRTSCLSVAFDAPKPPSKEDAARLVAAARELMTDAIDAAPESSRLLPAVLASSAEAAATLAAWQGVGERDGAGSDTPRRSFSVLRTPGAGQLAPVPDPELTRLIEAEASQERLTVETRVEQGQGRVWASLRSACPVGYETRDTAGYTGVALEHVAQLAGEGELSAFDGYGGPALVAHVPLIGDSPPEAVADALAHGLLRGLDPRALLHTISKERREALAANPLMDFASELMTRGKPSRVMAVGTHEALSHTSSSGVRAALLDFLRTPLTLTVIANQDATQGPRIAARLERLLSPFLASQASCPEVFESPLAGRYQLVTGSSAARLVLAYPLPLQQLPAARTVAFLLSRPGGFLDEALEAPGLVSHAEAAASGTVGGSAALFVALEAEPDALEPALAQTRALLQRVSGGALLEQHRRLAASQFRPPPRTTPLGRLFRESADETLPRLDELRRFAHSYLTEEKLVIVEARREE